MGKDQTKVKGSGLMGKKEKELEEMIKKTDRMLNDLELQLWTVISTKRKLTPEEAKHVRELQEKISKKLSKVM